MIPELQASQPNQTPWNKRKIGLSALLMGILLVIVGIASSSAGTPKNDGQLKRQTAIALEKEIYPTHTQVETSASSVRIHEPEADMHSTLIRLKADLNAQGWKEILACGNSMGGQLMWNEYGMKLAGLVKAAERKLFFVRFYTADKTKYVQSKLDMLDKSAYMNLHTNNHLNEFSGANQAARDQWVDDNWEGQASTWTTMKKHLTFSANNLDATNKLVQNGKVYWANGNTGGLHIWKDQDICVWDKKNHKKRGSVDMVFMFVIEAHCKPGCVSSLLPKDFAIAVDGSGSINSANFEIQRQMIGDLIQHIIPAKSGVGILQFASAAKTEINTLPREPLAKVLAALAAMKQTGGGTNIGAAMQAGLDMLKKVVVHPEPWIVLVTDGWSSNVCPQNIKDELKYRPVHVLIIGVTSGFNKKGVECLVEHEANPAGHILTMPSYSLTEFKKIVPQLTQALCV